MDDSIVVISDVGRVVLDFDNDRTARAFSRHSAYSDREIRMLLFHGKYSLCHLFDRGDLDPDQFRLAVRGLLQLNDRLTDEEFDECFADVFTVIEPVVDLWQTLRSRGVPVAALTNVDPIRYRYVAERVAHAGLPFEQWFDGITRSYEEGMMKPDRELFIRTLDKLGVKAESARFVDDIAPYVEAARALGIPSHVQKPGDVEGLVAFLKANGLENKLADH